MTLINTNRTAELDTTSVSADETAAPEQTNDSIQKLLMNYFLIVAFGGVMLTAGMLLGFAFPGIM